MPLHPLSAPERLKILLIAILFGLGVFLLLVISALAFMNRARLDEAQSMATQMRQLHQDFADLQAAVLSSESAQRGYLITGKEAYRDRYLESKGTVLRILGNLVGEEEANDRISLKAEGVTERIRSRLRELDEMVRIFEEEGVEAAERKISDSSSTAIREEISKIRMRFEQRLSEAELEYASSVKGITVWVNVAALIALLAGIFGLAVLTSHLNARAREISLEKEKEEAERSDQEKSKFLASMNHEIRTPLNAMLGFSELLRKEVSTPRGKRFLSAIEKSGNSLGSLINDILDLSKIEAGMLELDEGPLSIRDFAENIELLFENEADERGLEMSIEVADEVPPVLRLDGLRLRQILVNLIGNALKFTEEGKIDVRFAANAWDTSYVDLTIEVEDTGRGIEESQRREIFKPFRQSDTTDEALGGTGLGLSITRELVTLMDGQISVASKIGEGSAFRVLLPSVKREADTSVFSLARDESWDLNSLLPSRILVVDDNQQNLDLMSGFFEDTHHRLETVKDGNQCLEELSRHSYDLVLMDIRMPIMGGREALERMRGDERFKDIPVIAVTASSLKREEDQLRELFDGYVRKPFSGHTLFRECEKILAKVETEEESAQDSLRSSSEDSDATRPESVELPALKPEERGLVEEWSSEVFGPAHNSMVFSKLEEAARSGILLAEKLRIMDLKEQNKQLLDQIERFDQEGIERSLSRIEHSISKLV